MLTLTSAIETPLHRWPAGGKMAALCLGTVILFRLSTPTAMAAAMAVVALPYLLAGWAFARQGLRLLRPLWPFVTVVAVWHLWLSLPVEGGVIILRMLTAVAAANLVTMTTRLSDMLAVMERLLSPLSRFGLRPRMLALAVALVIRFVPVMIDRHARIAEAWRARSVGRPGWRILLPATLAALDDADQVADALRARGGIG